jgi:hypothetical protein
MKAVLEAALASRDAVFDRARLRPKARSVTAPVASVATDEPDTPDAGDIDGGGSVPIVMSVPSLSSEPVKPSALPARSVPDVSGMSVRTAAATLHRAGFRVRVVKGGARGATIPAAGATARPGMLIRFHLGQ